MLTAPGAHFASATLVTREVAPTALLRISRFATGEPYFGKSGGNRFDDPRKRRRYGTSYFGFDLHCAFAETVLHDEVADLALGGFPLVTTELDRYVLSFGGAPLTVAVLHGLPLKNLGVTARCRPSHRTTFRNSGRLPSTGIPVASTGFYTCRAISTRRKRSCCSIVPNRSSRSGAPFRSGVIPMRPAYCGTSTYCCVDACGA
ncbi:RES family NAD+ phosphorylase [Burkholderia sp. 1A5]